MQQGCVPLPEDKKLARLEDAFLEFIRLSSDFYSGPCILGQQDDLSAQEARVLWVIKKKPGCSVTSISIELDTSSSAISQCMDKLIKKGLVHRAPSPHDRRQVEMSLSPSGLVAMQEYELCRGKVFQTLREKLSHKNEEEVVDLISIFIDVIKVSDLIKNQ